MFDAKIFDFFPWYIIVYSLQIISENFKAEQNE